MEPLFFIRQHYFLLGTSGEDCLKKIAMSLFFLGSCRHACLKKNSASSEKDPTFDTISTQTGFQNNESLCYICVEMLATLGSQWHPECSIFARKMLQDATVNGIRNALAC